MNVSATRAYALMKELAYVRVSCTPEEKKAADRLLEVALSTGCEAHIEEFTVACGKVNHAKLVVTEPYQKEYECTGYERAISTPEGGLDAEFYYAETLVPFHLENCKGKIVMMNGRLGRKDYEKLQKAGAAAILTFSGSTLDRPSDSDCDIRKLRDVLTDPFGDAIALNIRVADAAEIVRRGAKKMHIELDSEKYDGVSHNICATIEGTKYPEKIISFGAHYDSVHFSTGVYDNLSGSVILMELLRYYAEHKPAYTLKFNWYGSEEQGLLGSKAWVAAHEDELDKHILMINVDVAAATLGHNVMPIMATDTAVGYIDGLMRELGFACEVKSDIYSSDCIPFGDKGIPAINMLRPGAPGANHIHDRKDNFKSNFVDAKALDITLQQALALTNRLLAAASFPIEKKICDEIKDKVDEYLLKKDPKNK